MKRPPASEDPSRSAAQLLTEEALRVVPREARELAGQQIGGLLVDVTTTVRQATSLVRGIVAIPGAAVTLVRRAWRRLTPDRRSLPPQPLLLIAAAGYAATDDSELRAAFESLVERAMDKESASRVHPVFARNLTEMTPLEARIMRQFWDGGVYPTAGSFSAAIGGAADDHAITIAAEHLQQLGLLRIELPPSVTPSFGVVPGATPWRQPGVLHIARLEAVRMTKENRAADKAILVYGTYYLTPLGKDFISVVCPGAGPGPTPVRVSPDAPDPFA